MERAATAQVNRQLGDKMGAATKRGEFFERGRIEKKAGETGFDDIVVEFTRSGGDLKAHVRIREVKDYPNRYVSLSEFTAISDNLKNNYSELKEDVDAALEAAKAKATVPRFKDFDAEQLAAIKKALTKKDVSIELVLSPTSKLGGEGVSVDSVITSLRDKIGAPASKGGLGKASILDGEVKRVEPKYIDKTKGVQ